MRKIKSIWSVGSKDGRSWLEGREELARRTAKESCRVMDNGELARGMGGVDLMDRGKDKVEKV